MALLSAKVNPSTKPLLLLLLLARGPHSAFGPSVVSAARCRPWGGGRRFGPDCGSWRVWSAPRSDRTSAL